MTRVIHTGDTHLGYRQYHRPERRADFLAAFRQVIDDAVSGDVDAVVHAGDLFHDRRPDLEDIMGALSELERLDDAGVPFLAVVGNHEAKRDAQWLDLYASLGLATRLGADPVEVGDVAFYGLDFVPRSRRENLELDFEPTDAGHAALVTHGLFEPFEFGEWDPRELFDAADVAFDALLLGDNHDPGTREVDGVWVTYCGSTERASAAEREDRGYNLVTFDDGVEVRRRGLETRAFVYVDVELGPGEGVERIRERLGEYDLDDAVVVVNVEGEGDPVTPAEVEEVALGRGALVARVTDHRDDPEETEREVSFADPDDAVRERVRELGLSEAARGIDETVRASKVADSNVASQVESRVRDLVDSGDGSAFATAADSTGDDASPTASAGETADSPGSAGATDGESGGDPGDGSGDADPQPDDPGDGSGDADPRPDDPRDGSGDADPRPDDPTDGRGGADPDESQGETDAGESVEDDAGDSQASMGEFL